MARSFVRNDGKIGKKRAFQSVSTKSLVKLEGAQEVIDGIEARLANLTSAELKKAFIEAGKPIYRNVKSNINGLNVSNELKSALSVSVSMSKGDARTPNIIVGMSQGWGKKRIAGAGFSSIGSKKEKKGGVRVPNPYWFEFGTMQRNQGSKGGPVKRNLGKITATPYFRTGVTGAKNAVRSKLVSELKALLIEE